MSDEQRDQALRAVVAAIQQLQAVFPGIIVGTAATATAGAAALPAAPAGFIQINVSGAVKNVPYYNT